jgi:hypothetical protein
MTLEIRNLPKTGLRSAAQLVVMIGQAASRYSTPTDKLADRSK